MNRNLNQIKEEVYDQCGFSISNFHSEPESKEYDACRFQLNGQSIVSRKAKVTPKKAGQFVTFWKRNGKGPIEPFSERDAIDFFVVTVQTENDYGQFVFPKSVLIKKGILSTDKKEGKRAFRVYPIWDNVVNSQAQRTQKWQLNYFYELGARLDIKSAKELYNPLE